MKLGFLTVSLNALPLEQIVPWAAEAGFEALELGCWPYDNSRDYSSTQVNVDTLNEKRADEILALFEKHNMSIACLTYCDNMLHRNLAKRKVNFNHMRKVIKAAAMLKVDTVCGFIGRHRSKTIEQNLALVGPQFKPLVELAAKYNIKYCVENCPMPDWQFQGLVGNVAHSPNVWDALFAALPYDNFGLNLDPSHLFWLGIDPTRAAKDYAHKIFFAHAKDTEIIPDEQYRRGIMDSSHGHWWRYRMPGLGQIDFKGYINALREGGFDGTLSIEHEDPLWEGSVDKVEHGLKLGLEHLRGLV